MAAVGQHLLMRVWSDALAAHGLVAGQVLLAPLDFVHRSQYLHARQTLGRLLELGVVPVVNENDAVADEEIRFGDNDRLAALVAHLVGAGLLVLLTDTAGLLTGDPRHEADASLIEEVVEIDHELEAIAGGPGTAVGSGGMGSKLAAAKIAVWSGIEAVIADAARPGVLASVAAGTPGVGTRFRPREVVLPARKLWIAFAIGASGPIVVDDGARRALVERGRSLLPAGIVSVTGDFGIDDAVEIVGPDGTVFAKGLVRHPAGDRWPGGPGSRPTTCPRTCRPRWSTATTWSCSADRLSTRWRRRPPDGPAGRGRNGPRCGATPPVGSPPSTVPAVRDRPDRAQDGRGFVMAVVSMESNGRANGAARRRARGARTRGAVVPLAGLLVLASLSVATGAAGAAAGASGHGTAAPHTAALCGPGQEQMTFTNSSTYKSSQVFGAVVLAAGSIAQSTLVDSSVALKGNYPVDTNDPTGRSYYFCLLPGASGRLWISLGQAIAGLPATQPTVSAPYRFGYIEFTYGGGDPTVDYSNANNFDFPLNIQTYATAGGTVPLHNSSFTANTCQIVHAMQTAVAGVGGVANWNQIETTAGGAVHPDRLAVQRAGQFRGLPRHDPVHPVRHRQPAPR